jgi:DNA-binding NarL/FixJ family response regulator
LLATQPDFRVVAKAGTGTETVQLVQQHHPDVLVLDLFMPEGDGFQVLRDLYRAGHRVGTVILTGSDNDFDYVKAVRLGARGLVLKGDDTEKLFGAIRSVAAGELAFSDQMAKQVITSFANQNVSATAVKAPTQSMERLSERERRIALTVARGLRNREIAQELGISENTVKRHLQSIFTKTGARDRLDLTALALAHTSRAA